jgi:hypothetical protein
MGVPGTNCSQKKFGKFFGLKKGDLVPGYIPKKNLENFLASKKGI